MPPKKAAKSSTKCDVCEAAIVEGKEDALLCEGPGLAANGTIGTALVYLRAILLIA